MMPSINFAASRVHRPSTIVGPLCQVAGVSYALMLITCGQGIAIEPTQSFNVETPYQYMLSQGNGLELCNSEYNGLTFTFERCDHLSNQKVVNMKKLDSIAALPDNWNEYGAPAFDRQLIEKVRFILDKVVHQPEIYPIAGGAIQFEYNKDSGDYLEFEIGQEDSITALHVDETGNEHEFSFASQIEDINRVVNSFYG